MTAAEEVEQPHVLPNHRCEGRARRGAVAETVALNAALRSWELAARRNVCTCAASPARKVRPSQYRSAMPVFGREVTGRRRRDREDFVIALSECASCLRNLGR
jgi:hypothetical protein